MNFATAKYCARYSIKKIRGQALQTRNPDTDLLPYQRIDGNTGEIVDIQPEYATMSRNPGIGKTWYEKFKDDIFPDDCVVYQGKRTRTPNYYRTLLAKSDPELSDQLASARLRQSARHKADQTPARP